MFLIRPLLENLSLFVTIEHFLCNQLVNCIMFRNVTVNGAHLRVSVFRPCPCAQQFFILLIGALLIFFLCRYERMIISRDVGQIVMQRVR